MPAGGAASASNTISWLFPNPVTAFGADFIGAGTNRLSLSGDFDGTGLQSLIVNSTIGKSDGFLGVIGTTSFSSIILGNSLTQVDSFSIDNASFAPVPCPCPCSVPRWPMAGPAGCGNALASIPAKFPPRAGMIS